MRVTAVLGAAFLLLLAATYIALNRDVKSTAERYVKAIVGLYSDVSAFMAADMGVDINSDFYPRLSLYGHYLCQWYQVDYLCVYVPDPENGTLEYVTVTRDRSKFGDLADDNMTGVTVKYEMSPLELDAWNGKTTFCVQKNERFGKYTEVEMAMNDDAGHRMMVASAMSIDDMRKDLIEGFLLFAGFIFIILVLLGIFLYFLLVKMVSRPARRISKKMSEYISGGKRSTIRLEDGNDDDEFAMMADSFNHMTEEMDRYIDDIARLGREQERQQTEVDIASEIQRGILPPGKAVLGNCVVKAIMKPAKYVGGDFFDYIELDRTHSVAVIADVSGKGISSAMLMAVALTLVRQFARLGYSPAGILRHVNDNFADENPKMMFVTAFIGIYDSESGVLTYANAGHNPPYLIQGQPRILDGSNGTPLGLFPGETYQNVEVEMGDGDTLLLYTDGVNEAVNTEGEFYGTERLENTLSSIDLSQGDDYVDSVEKSVMEFADGAEPNDDITILSLTARKNCELELDYDISQFPLIRDRLLESGLPRHLAMDLCIVAEECFVNICSYAFEGKAPEGEKIRFYMEYSKNVTMRFSDGGSPFDPRKNLPDTETYDIDTAVGGLGRLIAFTMADSVDYEYKEGRNVLTITKSI